MTQKELTKRQRDVLDYIKKYTAEHGFPPAIREICKGVNLSSPATVFVHMKNLEKAGYIKTTINLEQLKFYVKMNILKQVMMLLKFLF